MRKTIFSFIILLSVLLIIQFSFAETFVNFTKEAESEGKQYIQEEHREFAAYLSELEKEFAAYQRIVKEEYNKYREDILEHWQEAEITDKKKWVEYSTDYQTKRVVNFDEGYIKIHIITDKRKKDIEKFIENILEDLLLEDKKTAFERDKLSQNIENRIVAKSKHIKTDKVSKEPILSCMIVGHSKPTKEQVKRSVSELRQQGKLKIMAGKTKTTHIAAFSVALPPKSILRKARQYRPMVKNYADKREIDPALVLAVIHSESAFNPMATSYIPAYGLMQIVPQTGGKDAARFIYGKPVLLAPSYLYNDENNINVGTVYLHLLFHEYLKGIESYESKLYCTIASYNTGVGNVARVFAGRKNIKKAVDIINNKTPVEVYKFLMKKLPYEETRHYLKKVMRRIETYRSL